MFRIKKLIGKGFTVAIFAVVLLVIVIGGLGMVTSDARGSGPVVLMYHHLAPEGTYETTAEAENGAILAVENFEAQMKWLHDNGYNTMLMSEAMEYLYKPQDLPNKTVIITFDDGYESNYVYAYPILQKYNIKANMAVVVRDTERRDENTDISTYDPKTLRHMTFAQLVEMSDSGLVEIGSHSYNGHGDVNVNKRGKTAAFFTNIKYDTIGEVFESELEYQERITNDLAKSKTVLEARLGKPVNYLAYPYGRTNKEVVEAAQEVGFKVAVTTKAGSINLKSDPMELPRFNIDSQMIIEDFIKLVSYPSHE